MDISTAQSELRRAYVHGGPGTLVSGTVWFAAAITKTYAGVPKAFAVLFFGGMFIFPVARFVVVTCFRRQPESAENPGKWTVLETVFPMIGGLFSASLILPYRPEFAFSIVAISVGAHYFGFRTAYGDWTYWLLGGIMCAIGLTSIVFAIPQRGAVAFAIAFVEIIFGCWFLFVDYNQKAMSLSQASSESVKRS